LCEGLEVTLCEGLNHCCIWSQGANRREVQDELASISMTQILWRLGHPSPWEVC